MLSTLTADRDAITQDHCFAIPWTNALGIIRQIEIERGQSWESLDACNLQAHHFPTVCKLDSTEQNNNYMNGMAKKLIKMIIKLYHLYHRCLNDLDNLSPSLSCLSLDAPQKLSARTCQ